MTGIPIPAALVPHIRVSEGYSETPYRCPAGKLTIGYGTNIESLDEAERAYLGVASGAAIRRVTREQAEWLLLHRLHVAIHEAHARWPWLPGLSDRRRAAVYDMAYNLGVPKLAGFRRMLAALQAGDWQRAAAGATDSAWFRQVGRRGPAVVKLIREG